MADNWFVTGNDGWKVGQEEDKKAQEKRQNNVYRFHLKNGESAKVLFLDNPAFFLWEHSHQVRPGIYETFTCINQAEECPACLNGGGNSYGVAATIIRLTPIITKQGKTIKNQKQPIVFKGKAREKILNQMKVMKGNLKGCIYEMIRGQSPTECGTGEDFIYQQKRLDNFDILRKACPDKVNFEDWIKPFDYAKVFKPMSADEMRKMIGMSDPIGAASSNTGSGGDFNDLFRTGETSVPDSIDDIFSTDTKKTDDPGVSKDDFSDLFESASSGGAGNDDIPF